MIDFFEIVEKRSKCHATWMTRKWYWDDRYYDKKFSNLQLIIEVFN
ncbi:MAG: hypothetical protein O7173_00960 [Wolbachia endosymbiont of Nomada fabriciana]|nr:MULTISPECIES: hypothetical protein [unclassified Wolbachia]MDX5496234.1 hypothetical protein [Wolbachia endosymbiont of Nomada fabriciana]MDX5527820.1 hypothetical protein [Wolbachia endosymbiont of Andrena minutula]